MRPVADGTRIAGVLDKSLQLDNSVSRHALLLLPRTTRADPDIVGIVDDGDWGGVPTGSMGRVLLVGLWAKLPVC